MPMTAETKTTVGRWGWALFALGFLLIVFSGGNPGVALVGILAALVGLGCLIVGGKVWPS